jgi:hypothetical protein
MEIPNSNTTKLKVNPNDQIPSERLGIYWDFGFIL